MVVVKLQKDRAVKTWLLRRRYSRPRTKGSQRWKQFTEKVWADWGGQTSTNDFSGERVQIVF